MRLAQILTAWKFKVKQATALAAAFELELLFER
jgi:hypothetical protein